MRTVDRYLVGFLCFMGVIFFIFFLVAASDGDGGLAAIFLL